MVPSPKDKINNPCTDCFIESECVDSRKGKKGCELSNFYEDVFL